MIFFQVFPRSKWFSRTFQFLECTRKNLWLSRRHRNPESITIIYNQLLLLFLLLFIKWYTRYHAQNWKKIEKAFVEHNLQRAASHCNAKNLTEKVTQTDSEWFDTNSKCTIVMMRPMPRCCWTNKLTNKQYRLKYLLVEVIKQKRTKL